MWAGRAAPPGARRMAREDLHLTLAFLGTCPEEWIEPVGAALGAAAEAAPGIVPLVPVRARWLPLRTPRALAVELRGGEALAALHRATVGALGLAVGWEPDARPLLPHITVARRGRVAVETTVPPPASVPSTPGRGEEITLVRSVPGPAGSRYERVLRVPLTPTPG